MLGPTKILWEVVESNASARYFLETGREFSKLSPVEQRKLVEVELDGKKERSVPLIPRRNGLS